MEKAVRILEIPLAGSNSVLGGIYEILKDGVESMNDYNWVILVDVSAYGMIEDECKSLKLSDYILANRSSVKVKQDGLNDDMSGSDNGVGEFERVARDVFWF